MATVLVAPGSIVFFCTGNGKQQDDDSGYFENSVHIESINTD